MNIKQLLGLIYDKLADNDNNEQYMASMSEDMICNFEKNVIGILIDGEQYKLTLEKTNDIWE